MIYNILTQLLRVVTTATSARNSINYNLKFAYKNNGFSKAYSSFASCQLPVELPTTYAEENRRIRSVFTKVGSWVPTYI